MQSNTVKGLVGETPSIAVLDSGFTKNVCGKTCRAYYLETLYTNDARMSKQNPAAQFLIWEMDCKQNHKNR